MSPEQEPLHPEVEKWIQQRRSRGAKTTNKQLTGTSTARDRARKAAEARWAKHRETQSKSPTTTPKKKVSKK